MKKIILAAVITASLAFGFTSCGDPAKENLIAEIEKAKPEYVSLDSNLTAMQTYLTQKKDSILLIGQNEPKRKTEVDSIIKEGEKDMLMLDSVITDHKGMTLAIDSLLTGLSGDAGTVETASTAWSNLQASHASAKQYSESLNMAMLFILMSESQKDTIKVRNPKENRTK